MASSTVENYLKTILTLQQAEGGGAELVPMGRLATAMAVAPGTATSMVKTLAEAGLLRYEPRGGVTLTGRGEKLALHVVRRHRLVELFLVEVLKLDWSEVHIEAEELEHVISDKVLERIDELLGRPDTDPHGDPIPSAKGLPPATPLASLADCPLQQSHRVARVVDQAPTFLQFVDQHGLTPGADVVIESRNASADAVTVRALGRDSVTVGAAAAAKILVEPQT